MEYYKCSVEDEVDCEMLDFPHTDPEKILRFRNAFRKNIEEGRANGKPSPWYQQRTGKNAILGILVKSSDPLCVDEIMEGLESTKEIELTRMRVLTYLRQMIEDEKIERIEVGKKVFFSIKDIAPTAPLSNISAADEIKKFKELLDIGAISQEEYDAKKKQLLGL